MQIVWYGGDYLSDFELETKIVQENLGELRKIAGWTAENLAEKLDVTKQTISNLETGKVQMSRMQYIAIRSVFSCEMFINKQNATLRKVIEVLFDCLPHEYDDKKEKTRTAIISIASTAVVGISDLELYSVAVALLAPLGYITHYSAPKNNQPSLDWLLRLY